MRSLSTIFLFVFALAICISCKKKNDIYPVTGDYLISGHTGGFAGNLSNSAYYLIGNSQLRKDTSLAGRDVPDNIAKFNFNIVMPDSNYHAVADLLSAIPAELLSQNNADIGDPWPDFGVTDVRASIKGVAYRWTFEGGLTKCSPVVQQFVSRVKSIQ